MPRQFTFQRRTQRCTIQIRIVRQANPGWEIGFFFRCTGRRTICMAFDSWRNR